MSRADADELHREAVARMMKPKAPASPPMLTEGAGAVCWSAEEWAEIQADPFLKALAGG
jgi:hypothetical protein